jgi:hypothetical protein
VSIAKNTVITEKTPNFICVEASCHHTELVTHTFLKQHLYSIIAAIQQNDAALLKDYLTYTMQYSSINDWEPGYWGKNDDYHVSNKYWLDTCPVVEGLLRLYSKDFAKIVKLIADKNDVNLYRAFVESLEHASLSEEAMFAWNNNLKKKIKTGIRAFRSYAEEKLLKQDNSKAQVAINLTYQLNSKIELLETKSNTDMASSGPLESAPNYFSARLRILQFKLEFNDILHSKDKVLNRHRGYARLTNLFSILFTGGILNLVNYAVNGEFFFFGRTKSQSFVAGIEENILHPNKIELK